MISLPEFTRMWQQSIDVLEYQSPEVFRQHIVGGRWRSAIRYVLMSGVINALIVTVDGLINGANPIRSFVFAFLSTPINFALFTLGVFWVVRLFKQRIRLRDKDMEIGPGDLVVIPPTVLHRFEVIGNKPGKLIDFVAPPPVGAETIWEEP